MMTLAPSKKLSIKLASFFLKFVGFWIPTNPKENRVLDIALAYTIIAVLFGSCVVWMDFYYSMDDFYNFTYALTNVITLLIVLFKLFVYTVERKEFVELIKYSRDNFWDVEYDEMGTKILQECEQKCVLFVCGFTMFAQGTVCSYTITPIIGNIGKNETDRDLPFNIWLDFPVTTTPYYEILFFIETLSMYHIGIVYFCFDNLLCILNIHVNGQFRILNRRLEAICDTRSVDEFRKTGESDLDDERYVLDAYNSFKKINSCVKHHQSLIKFVDRMEAVFRITILAQVLVFSGLICLVSYQAFLGGGSFLRRIIFIVHSAGTFTQLLMFTLTCHDLWESSICVADGLYESGWYMLPGRDEYTKRLRKNIILILMRTRRPCYLTAFGFFPISLETFMTINSTAVSYLTILRQSADK